MKTLVAIYLFVSCIQLLASPHAFPIHLSDEAIQEARGFLEQRAPELATEVQPLSGLDWRKIQKQSFERALAAVALSKTGRMILTKTLPLYRSGKLSIESTYSEKARAITQEQSTSGFFIKDEIFVDDDAPLLAVAVALFHELVHAADFIVEDGGAQKTEALARARAGNAVMNGYRVLVETEHHAYRLQDQFLRELISLDPTFEPLILNIIDERYLVAYPIETSIFRRIMRSAFRIPEEVVENYLSKAANQ